MEVIGISLLAEFSNTCFQCGDFCLLAKVPRLYYISTFKVALMRCLESFILVIHSTYLMCKEQLIVVIGTF